MTQLDLFEAPRPTPDAPCPLMLPAPPGECLTCLNSGMVHSSAFVGEVEAWAPYVRRAEALRIGAGLSVRSSYALSGRAGPRPCPDCSRRPMWRRPASPGRVGAMVCQVYRAMAVRALIDPKVDQGRSREARLMAAASHSLSAEELAYFTAAVELGEGCVSKAWAEAPIRLTVGRLRDTVREFYEELPQGLDLSGPAGVLSAARPRSA